MPRALDRPVRQRIANLLPLRLSTAVIARLAGASVASVRRLRARLAQGDRPDPLQPDYGRCGRRRADPQQGLRLLCAQLRRQHATWGAGRSRLELRQGAGLGPLPTERTVQRWLQEQGLAPPAAVADRPPAPAAWATEAHDTWQMGAKERVRLLDGTSVCWRRLVDEASGAVLATTVVPVVAWADVEAEQVRQALRAACARWGKPRCLRVDNGYPWGASGGLPTRLALWLAGLAIALVTNPPRRPKANARVERSQRTAVAWAEPGACADAQALQQRLEEEDRLQRQEYPAIDGRSRLAAYPLLLHSGRGYVASAEAAWWDGEAALAWLGQWEVRRRVDPKGRVSLDDRHYQVGMAYVGQTVRVRLDAPAVAWVVRSASGAELRRCPARGLSAEEIRHGQVARPRRRRGDQTLCRAQAINLSVG
jgi:hypothetical protein